MALELTWGELRSYDLADVSTVAAIYKGTVFALKRFLTGAIGPNNAGIWTVVASSDGAGGYSSNSDLWVSEANVNYTSSGNRSWILLRQATLGVDLVIFCTNSSPQVFPTIRVAPCGTFTGGSASAAPTATTDFGFNFTSNSSRLMNSNVAGTASRVNALLSTRGDFWFLFSHAGTNIVYSAIGLSKLSDVKNADPFPWAMFETGSGQGFSKLGVHPMDAGNSGAVGIPCIHCLGYSGVAPANTSVSTVAGIIWPCVATNSQSAPTYLSASPLDRVALSQSDGKTLTFPVYIGITQDPIVDFKGRWPDALLGSVAVAVNTASPSVEAQQFIKAGPHMWLPFSGGILGL